MIPPRACAAIVNADGPRLPGTCRQPWARRGAIPAAARDASLLFVYLPVTLSWRKRAGIGGGTIVKPFACPNVRGILCERDGSLRPFPSTRPI
jgi:hypothetical protein